MASGGAIRRLCSGAQREIRMAKFLLEVPHESEVVACARAIKVLLETGSHFLTHADFGCCDGIHKAWIVVEADSKDEARNMLPVAYRRQASIVMLCKFGIAELDDLITRHTAP
jgi:hypothetical protein